MDDLIARHKREIKSLEGEKRAALKNAQGKGKKAKAAIKEVEFKYEGLERDLKERHRQEVAALNGVSAEVEDGGTLSQQDGEGAIEADDDQKQAAFKSVSFDSSTNQQHTRLDQQQTEQQLAEAKRQKALEKKLKKKNAQKQKEIDREKRIEQEIASAGPSPRILEMEALTRQYLAPNKLRIQEVQADGNCLYRAVGAQAMRLGIKSDLADGNEGYKKIRELCASILMKEREEFEPFAELDHDPHHTASTYEEYVEHVRSTSTWGGQLELRALSHGLQCPIVVFSAEGPPLTMGKEYSSRGHDCSDGGWEKKKAILVSFHRHYYALGEHYNSVVPVKEA
ncbi:hypothetical protein ACHAW6_013341 [Cyclotella cf. meneghiniana]